MRVNVDRGRSDQYGSWLVGELLLVLLLGSTVALFVRYPSLQDSYLLPQGRLVLDTSVGLIAAIVAVLAGTRFSVEGRRVDLLLCAAFGVTAMGTLAFEVAPAVVGGRLDAVDAWAGLLARLLAAALTVAAAFVTGRHAGGRTRALLTAAAGGAACLAAVWLLVDRLGPPPTRNGPALASAQGLIALLALAAAIGFGLRFRRERKDLDSWLALAWTLLLFADLHYVLAHRIAGQALLQGDFLRLIGFGVLLVGVWGAIRAAEFGRAVAEERARVAQEIHDGLAQYLFALSTHATMLEAGAPVEDVLPQLKEAAAAAQQEARFAVLALSSASGTAPFDAALRRYVEFLTADGELAVDIELEPGVRLAPDEQIEVFRIVQEGLANVRRHAGAHHAEVLIGERNGRRIVRVSDDGVGFEGAAAPAGQGLRNMRRRAESIEGGFALRSRPGLGTALEVTLRPT